MKDIHNLRRDYQKRPLKRENLLSDPLEQFKIWLSEALAAEEIEPNAMALATVGKDQQPACRHVLLKLIDEQGFIFFTNLNSRKVKQLNENGFAAASFWWRYLERQVSIEGTIEPVSRQIAADYFAKRPETSRLAAWASEKQSAPLSSREELERRFQQAEEKFKESEIPLPPFWGGFRIVPQRLEFWQGAPNRLHDRFLYLKTEAGWTIQRLYP